MFLPSSRGYSGTSGTFLNLDSNRTQAYCFNNRLFKPLVSAQTLAKMSVVGTGPATIGKDLLPHIDAKEVPKRYGGEAEAF